MGWNHQLDSFCSFLFFLCLAYFWESFVANQKGKGIKRQQKKHMTSSLINSQVELVDLRMVLRRLLSQLLGDQILWFKQMIEPPNIWVFPKMVAPPNYQFNRVFHYKPSILGYPYSRKHPYVTKSGIQHKFQESAWSLGFPRPTKPPPKVIRSPSVRVEEACKGRKVGSSGGGKGGDVCLTLRSFCCLHFSPFIYWIYCMILFGFFSWAKRWEKSFTPLSWPYPGHGVANTEIQDAIARQYQDVWSPNDLCLKINPPKQGPSCPVQSKQGDPFGF